MYQHIVATYRHITRLRSRSAVARKSIRLNILNMEERTTPAVLPLFQAPETVRILEIPAAIVPNDADAINASVRSDLFGVGGAGHTEPVKEWDAMLAADSAAKEEAACAPATPRPEAEVEDASAEVILVSAGETWLPPLE